MNKKLKVGLVLILLLLIVGVVYVFSHKNRALVGSVNCNNTTCLTGLIVTPGQIYAQNGISQGGLLSTTTPASLTLQASDVANESLLSVTPIVASVTLTLPASTTFATLVNPFLPNAGDSAQLYVHNASTTATINVTLAGGTGTLLQKASTTAVILPGGSATVDIFRKVNTDLVFIMSPAI